jgi:PAS domain S-box-containing protein
MVLSQKITAQIKDVLRKNPQGLSITGIVNAVKINRNTAGRYLESLLVSGQVEMRHFGMAKIYTLSHRVPLSAVLSISSELILQLDSDLRIVYANEPLVSFLGTTQKDLFGKNIQYSVMVPVLDDLFEPFMKQVQDGLDGMEWSGELTFRQPEIIFACRIAPTAFDNGQKGVSVILEDITGRKKGEERVRKSEELYRSLAETSQDLIFVIDAQDRVEYVNSYAATALQKTYEQLIGADRSSIFPPDINRRQEDALRRVFSTGESIRSENTISLGGTTRWFDHVLMPLKSPDGSVRAILGISRDITGRKRGEERLRKSEELYRSLAETSHDLIFVINAQDRVEYVNSYAAAAIGKTGNEIVNMERSAIFSPEISQRQQEFLHRIFTTGQSCHDQSPMILRGTMRWFDHFLMPLKNPDGSVWAVLGVSRDITGLRQITEELKQSEEKYRILVDHSQAGVFIIRGQTFVYANETLARIIGTTTEGLIQHDFQDFIVPEDRDWVIDRGLRRQRGEIVPESYEFGLLKRDGTTRLDVAIDAGLIQYEGETVSMGTIRDITRRKQMENVLRESEARYRRVEESMRDASAFVSMDGRLQEWNFVFRDMLGYLDDELAQLTYTDITPVKWRETEAKIIAEQVLPHGYSEVYEKEYCRKDGTIFPVELRTFLLRDEKGQPAGMWAIVRDITERKRLEEELRKSGDRFRRIFDDGPLAMATVDKNYRFVAVNRRFCDILGYSAEELRARTFVDITHPEHVNQDMAEIKKLYDGKIATYRTEKRYIRKDGSVIWGSLTVSPLRDKEGRIVSTIAIVEDITAQKHSEK